MEIEYTNKEKMWIKDLRGKTEETLEQEIQLLNMEAHTNELQAFCTKIFLHNIQMEQKIERYKQQEEGWIQEIKILRDEITKIDGVEEIE